MKDKCPVGCIGQNLSGAVSVIEIKLGIINHLISIKTHKMDGMTYNMWNVNRKATLGENNLKN